jgi:mono/diheme cytochrome c family protein
MPGSLLPILLTVAAFTLLMIAQGCSGRDGRDVYIGMGCPQCHGFRAEGLVQGPPLEKLSDRWTKDDLNSYLQNPAKYMAHNPRLQELSKGFTANMPAFTMGEKNREKLVEYLMGM